LKRKLAAIDQMWTQIEQVVGRLIDPIESVCIYQDGLPVCGQEERLVRDLAKSGSRNHGLLQRLIEKGAILMGTESPELLLEEYGLVKAMLASGDTKKIAEVEKDQETLSLSLLNRRDQFIADRINNTLGVGDTGVLFLGMLHSLAKRLAEDIRVIYPINRPHSP